MTVTTITLGTGREITVRGTYEDVTAKLAPRTLQADDGRREFVTENGRDVQVAVGAVAMVEAADERTTEIGFR